MNANQLRAMLEGIPDDDKIVVASGSEDGRVTGMWFQEGLVVLVAPDFSSQRERRRQERERLRTAFTEKSNTN